ncbi:SAM and PH domain protein [Aspergillus heteromorphus CBS 117.55]|uniref:SAM and PH domain protein n=1 Tax=Aspergillus heteromorphus CBS 117.55 TaxID=1448321 RepID=A0A317WY12_9EURO|nr:SAM and PH domain protein [Aspergillus heteromorphus CBS 117.55]PWY91263.1 SAM and PH domain protein [Aspergillus heteromorphus CBS 117.55]
MTNTKKFQPAFTVVKARQSATTNFDDTDFEYSDSDEESPRMSMGSFGYDSVSSASTPDPPTPEHVPREVYLHRKSTEGPSGPHLFTPDLFRSSIISSRSVPTTEIDLYFERSPVQSQFQSDIETPQFPMSEVDTPSFPVSDLDTAQFTGSSMGSFTHSEASMSQASVSQASMSQASMSQASMSQASMSQASVSQVSRSESSSSGKYVFPPCAPQPHRTVYPDVSQVEEDEIRGWAPSQVAHWMHIGGYDDSVIEKFMINDIAGDVLLNLHTDDLKELGIQSFGKRHQIMGSIDHLRNTMLKRSASRNRAFSSPSQHSYAESASTSSRSYAASVSPTGEVISREPNGNQLTETEAVSIVGIEQVLPKPHNCSKGENCPKYRRYQRQMEKLATEYPEAILIPGQSIVTGNPGNPQTAHNMLRPKSDTEPSVIASSDVFGPQITPRLSEEALNEVKNLDPQEKMRQFFSYQHVDYHHSGSDSDSDSDDSMPSPAPHVMVTAAGTSPASSPPAARLNNMTANLRNLPKLMIPTDSDSDDLTTAVTAQRTITPSMGSHMYGSPTVVQEYGPFSNARQVAPADYYRQGTPFSEVDAPVVGLPEGPVARETSQSVPPDMRYGNLMRARYGGPISRSPSVRAPTSMSLRRVKEGKPLTPIDDPADLRRSPRIAQKSGTNTSVALNPDVTRSGYMKKRKPARFLRHDWQEAHFTLRGTNLAMHKDELSALRQSRALDEIDVDAYAVACSSLASSSKLTAALKKSILRNGNHPGKDDSAFTFSLVPASKENEKKMLFGSKDVKSHHFAVKTRDERIDWMRDMMLAKALKKGKDEGYEMRPEGNFI